MGWDLQCVLEEGITNAVKHGHATRVTVELESDAHSARLRVTDNGDGLTDGGEPGRLSTGVSGMRARLSAWQGAVTLEDADSGAALTVELRIPEG